MEILERVDTTDTYALDLNLEKKIIAMRFYGDMPDEDYREIWEKALKIVIEHQVKNYVIDQSKIGTVSFTARAWVLVKVLPQVRKKIGMPLFVGILPSENLVHSTGMEFIAKGFQKLSGMKIRKFRSEEECVGWLTLSEEEKINALNKK